MKLLLKRRKKQHIADTTETGRSMVEILGVLAVIGVLSIGGIWGYTYAMDRYQANDILNAVNMRGKDTWNRFQDKELPDSEEIDEWEAHTSTGFPIAVIPIPDTEEPTFRVDVDNVPSRVCKMVLLGQYNSILAKVENDSGVNTYGTDLSICDDSIEQKVNMKFLWALNSETAETRAEEGKGKSCATTDDCTVNCERCNTERYVCEADCPEDTPVCCQETGVCVECEGNAECSGDEICNLDTKQCEKPQAECPSGTFRGKDGWCYKCDNPSNIEITKEHFTLGDVTDTVSGDTYCNACADAGLPRMVKDSEDKTYCSYTCQSKIDFQSINDGCISCTDTTDYAITKDDASKNLCAACDKKTYTRPDNYSSYLMCGYATCGTGEFKWFELWTGGNHPDKGYCSPCGEFANEKKFISIDSSGHFIDLCNNCPNRFYYQNGEDPDWVEPESGRFCKNCGFCYPKCSQPDETDSITICQEEGATSTNCKRQYQALISAECIPCNSTKNAYVGTDTNSPFYKSCISCGRTVNTKGYCVLGTSGTCDPGYFKEYGTENCVSCKDNKWTRIEDDTSSGCTSQCKQNESGEYVVNGPVDTKMVVEMKKSNKLYKTFCATKCAGETVEFMAAKGICYSCSKTSSKKIHIDESTVTSKQLQDLCNACSDMEANYYGARCSPISCGKDKFHDREGTCRNCNTPTTHVVKIDGKDFEYELRYQQECKACENRILLGGYCAYIDKGVSGICNSIENGEHEDYPAGDRKKFRDIEGYCHDCTDSSNYRTTAAQCANCTNRRYNGTYCNLGHCTSEKEFLATESASVKCVSCTDTSNRIEIPTDSDSIALCDDCADKRAMTHIDASGNEVAGCVSKCLGTQWQALDGECLACAAKDSVTEIGNDTTSRNQCGDCGRVVFSVTADEKTTWYCSQYPEEEVHFIDVNGQKIECTETRSTEILNLGKARSLCTKCGRSVVTNDETGAVTCEL